MFCVHLLFPFPYRVSADNFAVAILKLDFNAIQHAARHNPTSTPLERPPFGVVAPHVDVIVAICFCILRRRMHHLYKPIYQLR